MYILICCPTTDVHRPLAAAESGYKVSFESGHWGDGSDLAKDFLRQLFSWKAHLRPQATQLLLHPWFCALGHAGMGAQIVWA